MFLTWLLESTPECEIAHMVARAGTLVPISENETKLTFQVPGFSQHRRCVIARAPAFGGAHLRARRRPCGPSPVGWPHPGSEGASAAVLARLRAVCGHGKAPAGAGAFGSAFEVFQDVCQVCGVVAAEFFEEVDLDVHLGFSFLSSPLLYLHSINRHHPVSSPSGVSFTTFSGTVSYPDGTYRRVTLPPSRLPLRTRKLRPGKLPRGNIRQRNITQA